MYCTVGTAGHVDHGKTALVKALTGVDTDSLAEEKARGLSIELGFAHFEAHDIYISIIDVPGHERFIRTMLAGTTGIDVVLFVVAVDDGVMPQSREHLDIVRLLNIKSAVFVLSKVDRVDEDRVNEVKGALQALIKGTPLEGSPFVSTSAVTGAGVDELRDCLVSSCSAIKAQERGPFFRLPVDRSFTIKGFGTVVTGTVASGIVHKSDTVGVFQATSRFGRVRVRGIESAHKKVESAVVGARGALNVANLPHGALSRGATLADCELVDYIRDSLQSSSGRRRPLRCDCSFEFLPSFDIRPLLKGKKSLKLFHLTGDSLVSVRFADKSNPSYGRLTLTTSLLCLRGDRFILRDTATNTTVGGGRVLLPYYTQGLARGVASTDYKALKGTGISNLLLALLGPREVGLKLEGLDFLLNLTREDIIKDAGGFSSSGGYLLKSDRARELRERLKEVLEKFHEENPAKEGLSITEAAALLKEETLFSLALEGRRVIKVIVDDFVEEGGLVRANSLLRLPGHSPSLGDVDLSIEKAVLQVFVSATPVKAEELYALPFKRGDIESVVLYLLNKRRIVKLTYGKFLLSTVVDEARESLEGALKALEGVSLEAHGAPVGITVGEFRDILGTGRKMAIEILEYFDRELVTLRDGDYRVLRSIKGKGRDNIV